MEGPVDGWIVYTAEPPLFWLIKGYHHPEHGFVAVPYRRLDGRRLNPLDYIAASPQWLLRFLPCIGRNVPVVPRNSIVRVLDPAAGLRVKPLPEPLAELLDHVGVEWAGITGSRLTGHESEDSDYDLLVLPAKPEEAVKTLVDLKADELISECRGMRGTIVDACYRGYPYTLRLLREVMPRGCTRFTAWLGWWKGLVEITLGGVEAYLVPAVYKAVLSGGTEAILYSWRTRYQGLEPGCYEAVLELFEDGGNVVASPDIGGRLKRVGRSCGPMDR